MLHIIWKANFGGIEKLVYELANEQHTSENIEVAVLILKDGGEYLERFQSASFKLYNLNFKSGNWASFTQLSQLSKIINDFDLIHLHSFNPWVFFSIVKSGKIIVYTEHGNFGFGRKAKNFDQLLYKLRRFGINRFAKAITYNSNFTKKYAEDYLGYSKGNFRKVVYNGVKNTSEKAIKLAELDQEFVVGTWSRFAGFKRIDRLIKAFAQFQKGRNTKLLLIGDGVLKAELKQLCKKVLIEDKVVFTNYVEQPKQYISQMQVTVFPSEQEPFGLVSVEALQYGKQTIVFSDGGGLVEIINPISTRNVVESVSGLVDRLEECYLLWQKGELDNYEEINKRKARAADFTIGRMNSQLEEIYLSL